MKRRIRFYAVFALVWFVVGAVAGVLIWQAARAGSGEPSEPISAPTLDINAVPTFSQTQAAAFATQNADLETQLEALAATSDANAVLALNNAATADAYRQLAEDNTSAQAVDEPAATLEPTNEIMTEEATAPQRILYRITPDESAVRFNIDETLRGDRITVVGATNEVAGDVIVDFGDPIASQLGTVRINVRTLATDNSFRNNALRSDILASARDEYEFAEFVPTSLAGLPDAVAVGDTVEFQITGDLTLHGMTRPVTFAVTVTLTSTERIAGYARATVLYRDFDLRIPAPSFVADIADEVILEIDFVALAVEDS